MKNRHSPPAETSPLVVQTIATIVAGSERDEPGAELKTEHSLKELCGVSRTTVRKALAYMHAQGWIRKGDHGWIWTAPPETLTLAQTEVEYRGREDQARAYLIELLASGRIKPGMPVTEVGIAKALGMSTVPVREAMRSLEGLGLLIRRERRSWQTAKLTDNQVAELMEVRRLVELHCLDRLATGSKPVHLKALNKIRASTQKLLTGATFDLVSGFKVDRAFHETLLHSSENRFLIEHNRFIYILIEYEFAHSAMPPAQLQEGLKDHLKVLDAIHQGNWKTARKELLRHLNTAEIMLLKALRQSE